MPYPKYLAPALLLALGWPAPAPAQEAPSELDARLVAVAAELRDQFLIRGYKNIAVVKFAVVRAGAPESYNAGVLNEDVARRLELALLYRNADGKLNLIKNASAVAHAADPASTVETPEGRRKLFTHAYPLHWGTETVHPHVIVAGVVRVGFNKDLKPDPERTVVRLVCFDAGNPARVFEITDGKDPLRFEVATTRQILSAAGAGFRARAAVNRPASRDDLVVRSDDDRPVASQIDVAVVYGDTAHAPRPAADGTGLRVPPPPLGRDVIVRITNRHPTRAVGVVVGINGRSTLYKQADTGAPLGMTRWIIDGGKTFEIRGFLKPDDKEYEPFQVVAPEQLRAAGRDLGGPDALGLIVVHEIQDGDGPAERPAAQGLVADARGKSVATAREAAEQVRARFPEVARGKNVIVGAGAVPITVAEGKLGNPVWVGTTVIRYTTPPPRPDDPMYRAKSPP